MTNTKPWYHSKTVAVNALIIVLAALDALQLLPAVPPGWAPYILAGQGFLNVVLRLTTSSGISGFAPAPMRADPALETAPSPAAGAPSLAAQIAADNGLAPPEKEG